jgi:hypothetical protein
MARTARREPEPETEPEDGQTVHDELLDAAIECDPKCTPKHSKEDDQTYLKRIVVALADAPNEIWNKLSEDAQNWFNDATDAMNDKKPVAAPEGFDIEERAPRKQRSAPQQLAERVQERRSRRPAAQEPEEEQGTGDGTENDEPAPARRSRGEPASGRRESAGTGDGGGRRANSGNGRDAPSERRSSRDEREADPSAARKKAAAAPAREGRGPSAVAEIRRYLIKRPKASNEDILNILDKKGLEAKDSTINATRASVLSTIADIKAAGYWAEK